MQHAMHLALTAAAGMLLVAPPAPAQDPRPAPTRSEVVFQDGTTKLTGTLLQPHSEAAFAAVVILGGAERGPRNGWKERMAAAVAARGVAALIYDSPGTGTSTGSALLQTRADRAREAIAAVRFLQSREGIERQRVGVWGTSEGANISLLAAAECRDIAFAVASSGMFGMSPLEVARYRIETQSAELRQSIDEVAKALLFAEILFALVTGPEIAEWPLLETKAARWPDEPWTELMTAVRSCRSASSRTEKDDVVAALGRAIGHWRNAPWFAVAVTNPAKFDRILGAEPDAVLAFLRRSPLATGDWYASWREFGTFADIRCPILAVWGGKDRFVPPSRSAAALRACVGDAEDRDVTIRILPEASHVFTTGGLESAIVDGYPELLVDWLRQRLR